ncbi:glutamate receptor ionotropic, kainate 4 [Monomorium pharaonis]|uniref:glutamate receptor ionotropic, kainate 4 n=1 Tax=Monomorium pharaonis TaxID=307658 RepID=UPI00174698B6|nr:glutamate receptor ionotropic, kainate 4 [Monomorium pharaonis]
MKYMTARSIAVLFIAFSTKPLIEGIGINNYFQLINDVHRYYHTSCVIFVQSDKYDFNTTTLVQTWSREFSWQAVMTVTMTFSDLKSEYNKYQESITRPLFVVLLDTRETMDQFVKITRTIKPISFPFWFIVFFQHPGNPLEKYCREPTDNIFNVDFRTQMLVLCYDSPILVEWYAIRDNRTRTFDLATWSPDRGLILKTRESLYARRDDMFGDVIRVVTVNNSPLISQEDDMVSGFLGVLLLELSKVMNFTVKLLDPVEGYGWLNEQKTGWTGAIGKLVANEADLGVSAFTMTTHRLKVVDFTMPLLRSQYRLYFKQSDLTHVQWSVYLRVFSPGIWISLTMITIVAAIVLTIIKTKGFSIILMLENYIKVWGIYCQQSLPAFPRESPMRLAFISMYISSIVILSMYSASLISYLALSKPKLPFSTLEGFVNHGSYQLIVMQDSAEYDLPSNVHDSVFIKMYKLRADKKYLPFTLSEGFREICEHANYAFYTSEMYKESINFDIRCRVTFINTGRIDNTAMALTKGNPYTEFINYHLRRFQLNGIMGKLKKKFLIKNVPSKITYHYVELNNITPILTMVAGSMVLALLILIIEKVFYSFKTQFKNNKLFIAKFSYNLNIRNKLRRENSDLKLKFKEFYNNRPIGYWP